MTPLATSGRKRAAREIRACEACGAPFSFALSQLNAYPGGGRYCSRACKYTGHERECARCTAVFRGPEHARFCSPRCRQRRYELLSPVDRKAWSLAANVLWGPGKAERMRALLRTMLGEPCIYCQVTLTLGNIGLDHREPLRDSALRKQKAAHSAERRWLDRPENIQLICRECNNLKGRLNDEQFRALLQLTDSWGEDGARFLSRLRASGAYYTLNRRSA